MNNTIRSDINIFIRKYYLLYIIVNYLLGLNIANNFCHGCNDKLISTEQFVCCLCLYGTI